MLPAATSIATAAISAFGSVLSARGQCDTQNQQAQAQFLSQITQMQMEQNQANTQILLELIKQKNESQAQQQEILQLEYQVVF